MNFIKENKGLIGLLTVCITVVALRLIDSSTYKSANRTKLEGYREALKYSDDNKEA